MSKRSTIIIGAGPAGLTAAYELARRGHRLAVLEKSNQVGGIARTETYKGYRFDIGGHRFHTKVGEVQRLWREMLGPDLRRTARLSRIFYDGRFFHYPIDAWDTLRNLGVVESVRIAASYLKAKLVPHAQEETFEEWVIHRFGRRLYETFFKTYTQKVWGIPCSMIRADWAAQRIMGLSLMTAVVNATLGTGKNRSLIKEFDYPLLGPGMMWERFKEAVEQRGGRVCLGAETVLLRREGARIKSVTVRTAAGTQEMAADHFISSMPLGELIGRLDPPPPARVLEAARGLKHRDFILVGLIIARAELFPDNWLYIHTPDVRVGRIQNFKNWSAAMVPDPRKTGLGMEYFCTEGDDLWTRTDAGLIGLATGELVHLGLAHADEIEDGIVIRQPKAYPVYDTDYRKNLQVIQEFVATLTNLQTIGRNGLHRYNNQDHSMLTALLAVRNLEGESHNLWDVNTERAYHEEL
ncbi:MAG: NAD(P)/FAD-dependent oxidoreductase [Verrucomicrobiae bacterium]|nr:NAD(P)/FAD-dependent oxidoreductase [Verrucomicrobiae bacterium]